MQRYILIKLFLIFSCQFSVAQKSNINYEQLSLNFFIDSVFRPNYEKIKCIYYDPTISSTLSVLRHDAAGFRDYETKKDSNLIRTLDADQIRIKGMYLSSYVLNTPLLSGIKILPNPVRKTKMNLRKSIQIKVFKRMIARQDYFVVELFVIEHDKKSHFYFELSESGKVERWYKVMYVI
jgi:hypothetical protein